MGLSFRVCWARIPSRNIQVIYAEEVLVVVAKEYTDDNVVRFETGRKTKLFLETHQPPEREREQKFGIIIIMR